MEINTLEDVSGRTVDARITLIEASKGFERIVKEAEDSRIVKRLSEINGLLAEFTDIATRILYLEISITSLEKRAAVIKDRVYPIKAADLKAV